MIIRAPRCSSKYRQEAHWFLSAERDSSLWGLLASHKGGWEDGDQDCSHRVRPVILIVRGRWWGLRPRGHLAMSGDILVFTTGGMLLESSGLRPEILLKVLQCTGQPSQQSVSRAEVAKPRAGPIMVRCLELSMLLRGMKWRILCRPLLASTGWHTDPVAGAQP